MTIDVNEFKKYIITGYSFRSNKKFRLVHSNPHYAFGINLWNGRVWGVREDGTKKLLKHVVN